MDREDIEEAIEALEDANDVARMEFSDENYYSEAINALRQALVDADDASQKRVDEKAKREHEWVGLTDEELKPLCDENHIMFGSYTVDFIQAIEAKLREKNT
jgi:hypothetical protein